MHRILFSLVALLPVSLFGLSFSVQSPSQIVAEAGKPLALYALPWRNQPAASVSQLLVGGKNAFTLNDGRSFEFYLTTGMFDWAGNICALDGAVLVDVQTQERFCLACAQDGSSGVVTLRGLPYDVADRTGGGSVKPIQYKFVFDYGNASLGSVVPFMFYRLDASGNQIEAARGAFTILNQVDVTLVWESLKGVSFEYVWTKNGSAYNAPNIYIGSNPQAVLYIPAFNPATDTGVYTVTFRNKQTGESVSASFDVRASGQVTPVRPVALSIRNLVGPGDQALIAGFIITGPAGSTKKLVLRGLGPHLAASGVSNFLKDPKLSVMGSAGQVAANDDWVAATRSDMDAAGLDALTVGSKDAALSVELTPGVYTVLLMPSDGVSSGEGLIEVYDLERAKTDTYMYAISCRAAVPANGTLIGGAILDGFGSRLSVTRGIGPGIASSVSAAMPDPVLSIRVPDSTGSSLVASNDDWVDSADARTAMASLGMMPPASGSKDAILVRQMNGGAYFLMVSGKSSSSTDVTLFEMYFK